MQLTYKLHLACIYVHQSWLCTVELKTRKPEMLVPRFPFSPIQETSVLYMENISRLRRQQRTLL